MTCSSSLVTRALSFLRKQESRNKDMDSVSKSVLSEDELARNDNIISLTAESSFAQDEMTMDSRFCPNDINRDTSDEPRTTSLEVSFDEACIDFIFDKKIM